MIGAVQHTLWFCQTCGTQQCKQMSNSAEIAMLQAENERLRADLNASVAISAELRRQRNERICSVCAEGMTDDAAD